MAKKKSETNGFLFVRLGGGGSLRGRGWFRFCRRRCCFLANGRFLWRNRRCRCTCGTRTAATRSRTSASSVSSRSRRTTSWCSTSASTPARSPTAAPTATAASSSSATSSSTRDSTPVRPAFVSFFFSTSNLGLTLAVTFFHLVLPSFT